MLRELEYPFDSEYLLKKSKKIKKQLLAIETVRIKKKVAVLGGSTTHDIVRLLELFLLNQGIEPIFYESEFGQYWQDVMFEREELMSFHPDIIYIHTSNRNIKAFPILGDSSQQVECCMEEAYQSFQQMWDKIRECFHCPVIQNNFEYPFYRLLGNKDAVDIHGRISFLSRLNERFYEYARQHDNFYINDINYLSASFGLDKWADPFYWHMYKYALCLNAIPDLAFQISNIIKSLYGKNKKALVLDLDHTLWGGVVGDDGPENLEIGQETSMGQVYSEFQAYLKAQKDLGVLLNVASKNEHENAIAGLNHPEGVLRPDDFIVVKANWEPKSLNVEAIAAELNVLPDSLVFVDDNPAEREIVRSQVAGVAVPEIGSAEQYIRVLNHSGFFEVTELSEDDKKRNEMYHANAERAMQQQSFSNYEDYLRSLEMKAIIRPFEPFYMARIAQLTNKSNQFNLTTKRYTQSEIEEVADSNDYLTLYGKLEDKFGDNGVVSVLIGRKQQNVLHIDLWLMSCRVLKRDMEYAMMDQLVACCKQQKIDTIKGYYLKTAKNAMVKNFYELQGFLKEEEDSEGNAVWIYKIGTDYQLKNNVIAILGEEPDMADRK